MRSIKKLFDVTGYENESLFIVATIKRGAGKKNLFITKEEFNNWMLRKGRLNPENDICSKKNTCNYVAEAMNTDDYWRNGNDLVKADLYEFIKNELLTPENNSTFPLFKVNKPVKRRSDLQMPADVY